MQKNIQLTLYFLLLLNLKYKKPNTKIQHRIKNTNCQYFDFKKYSNS